jgi:hypothetical protein
MELSCGRRIGRTISRALAEVDCRCAFAGVDLLATLNARKIKRVPRPERPAHMEPQPAGGEPALVLGSAQSGHRREAGGMKRLILALATVHVWLLCGILGFLWMGK